MRPLIDISPLISPRLAVFPGDTPFAREVLMEMQRGDHITLSTIRSTVHLGAHADAVSHYGRDGATIDAMPLDLYLGPCRVIDVSAAGARGHPRVTIADLGSAPIDAARILLRTSSSPDAEQWAPNFLGIDPALIDHLADRGVKLLGVDTPSVDTADSKDLPAHARCLARTMAIIEGLVLREVPAGTYEFIGLPLKLEGCDASPIRAVLR
ncbi:MAG: cyclase family protein [Phycisphaeraceae bacterium]|nr:cyclase family protein [Phycisphaeraceae bacterium]